MSASVLSANLEEGALEVQAKVRRPWCLFISLVFAAVFLCSGGWSPLTIKLREILPKRVAQPSQLRAIPTPDGEMGAGLEERRASTPTPDPAPSAVESAVCGDGKCQPPETIHSCLADCPGVTTPPMCGESPHSDPGGFAVADGRGHKAVSAADCCEK